MTQVKKRALWDILTLNEKRVFAKRIISAGVLFAVGLGLELWEAPWPGTTGRARRPS